MSEESAESLLREIFLKRGGKPLGSGTKCCVCLGDGNFFRKKNPEWLFCSDACNKVDFITAQIFQLGMKRTRELEAEEIVIRLKDIPVEIQAHIILMVFHYRLEDLDDWRTLMRLKLFVMKGMERFVDRMIIPQFQFVDGRILDTLPDDELLNFRGIQEFDFLNTGNMNRDWNGILREMNQLASLSLMSQIQEQEPVIELAQFSRLTRLVTGTKTESDEIKNLTNLIDLTIVSEVIDDDAIKRLTKLTKLRIGIRLERRFLEMEDSAITENAFIPLKNLEKVGLYNLNGDSDAKLPKLTGLKKLRLERVYAYHFETLTNLTSLHAMQYDELGLFEDSLEKLTNLKKLTTWGGEFHCMSTLTNLTILNISGEGYYGKEQSKRVFKNLTNLTTLKLKEMEVTDKYLSYLTNLKSLSLTNNNFVTERGITSLTTLTYLSLKKNQVITLSALRYLKNLRRLKESSGRIYHVNNGVISLY